MARAWGERPRALTGAEKGAMRVQERVRAGGDDDSLALDGIAAADGADPALATLASMARGESDDFWSSSGDSEAELLKQIRPAPPPADPNDASRAQVGADPEGGTG